MTGFLRSLPDLAPTEVMTTIGHSGIPRSVLASRPLEASYFSTWSRTHWAGLGSYSPESAMWGRTESNAAVFPDRALACRA